VGNIALSGRIGVYFAGLVLRSVDLHDLQKFINADSQNRQQ